MSGEEHKIKPLVTIDQILSSDRTSLKSLKVVIKDGLEALSYYNILMSMLEREPEVDLFKSLSLQKVFKILDSMQFNRSINFQAPFLNNRSTRTNIRNLKSALLIHSRNYAEIGDTKNQLLIFQLKENELNSEGVPADPHLLQRILQKNNQSIYAKNMHIWLDQYKHLFEKPGCLQSYEFLFLASNAESRDKYLKKVPKFIMEGKMNEKCLFSLNPNLQKELKTPEQSVQQQMQYVHDEKKASQQCQVKRPSNGVRLTQTDKKIRSADKKSMFMQPEVILEIRQRNLQTKILQNRSKQAMTSLNQTYKQSMAMKEVLFETQQSCKNIKQIIKYDLEYERLQECQRESVSRVQRSRSYQRLQMCSLKPVHEKIIETLMQDITNHRTHYKHQIEQRGMTPCGVRKCVSASQNNFFREKERREKMVEEVIYADQQIEEMKRKQRRGGQVCQSRTLIR